MDREVKEKFKKIDETLSIRGVEIGDFERRLTKLEQQIIEIKKKLGITLSSFFIFENLIYPFECNLAYL